MCIKLYSKGKLPLQSGSLNKVIQNWQFSHFLVTSIPMESPVESFIVHKTVLELHSKTSLHQHLLNNWSRWGIAPYSLHIHMQTMHIHKYIHSIKWQQNKQACADKILDWQNCAKLKKESPKSLLKLRQKTKNVLRAMGSWGGESDFRVGLKNRDVKLFHAAHPAWNKLLQWLTYKVVEKSYSHPLTSWNVHCSC